MERMVGVEWVGGVTSLPATFDLQILFRSLKGSCRYLVAA